MEKEPNVLKQYADLKAKHPDRMLLFRNDRYYQLFNDDAKEAVRILGINGVQFRNDPDTAMALFGHEKLDIYLPKLIRAGKRIAICDMLPDPPKTKIKRGITETINDNNNQTSEDKTMATKNNNESKNVQNAQVNNETIDVNVGEVTVDSIMPVMQPVEGTEYGVESDGKTATFESVAPSVEPEKPAVTVPLGDHGTLVIGGVPKAERIANADTQGDGIANPAERDERKPKKPHGIMHKVTLKRKVQDSVPQTESTLPLVRLVVYTTKRGEQAPRIEGFGGENDPRWKRHYDDKVRLAKEKKEADAFNEKLTEKMKGKSKAEREKLRKQWKSVGSDPFGASYFTDRTTGDKYYQMTMGAKYLDVARELVDAYNSGDEQAIAAAEQAVIDCKNGIVKDIEAEKAAKRAEREAKKSLSPDPSPKGEGSGYSDQDVADMLRKVLAGGDVPENIKKLLQAA